MRDVPDFPKEGIVFKDLMPLIGDGEAFHATVGHLADWSRPRRPDVILGAEARGFIFGGALAYELGCGFVPARKPGKLPWEKIRATYDLEYGTDSLEIHADAFDKGARVIVLDDVLATGGTAQAKLELVETARRRGRRRALRDRAGVPRGSREAGRDGRARADRVLSASGMTGSTPSDGSIHHGHGRCRRPHRNIPAPVPGARDRPVRLSAFRQIERLGGLRTRPCTASSSSAGAGASTWR